METDLETAAAPPAHPPPNETGEALFERIRAGDEQACARFLARYLPLLRDAVRPHQVPPEEQLDFVTDIVTDLILDARRGKVRTPRSVEALLMTMLRRRVIDRHRSLVTRRAVIESLDATALAIAEASAMRNGEGPLGLVDDEALASGDALLTLADQLHTHMTDDDVQILVSLGERVPQRVIAEWFGISAGAMRMRIARLRERLRQVARTAVGALDDDARAELGRFLRRANLEPSTPPRAPTPSHPRPPGGRRHGASS